MICLHRSTRTLDKWIPLLSLSLERSIIVYHRGFIRLKKKKKINAWCFLARRISSSLNRIAPVYFRRPCEPDRWKRRPNLDSFRPRDCEWRWLICDSSTTRTRKRSLGLGRRWGTQRFSPSRKETSVYKSRLIRLFVYTKKMLGK